MADKNPIINALQTRLGSPSAKPRGTNAQILKERELTTSAINGAMAFGHQNTNPPPDESHWLAPFWKMGREKADAEEALRNLLDTFHSGRVAIDPSAAGWVSSCIEAGEAALGTARATAFDGSDLRESSLAMMIRRLCSKRIDGTFTITDKRRDEALELLRSMGLEGSPLRAEKTPGEG